MTVEQEAKAWSTVVDVMKAFIKNADHSELINIDNLVDYIVADDYGNDTEEFEYLATNILNSSTFTGIFDDSDVILTEEQLGEMLHELESRSENAQRILNKFTI